MPSGCHGPATRGIGCTEHRAARWPGWYVAGPRSRVQVLRGPATADGCGMAESPYGVYPRVPWVLAS
ncbi:Uncharacterised protein [Mycobacteroides abscessus subsp. abscessus]|nr:Uncharacterised protein [Mycobacteroides abscessus subsp. abscessus]